VTDYGDENMLGDKFGWVRVLSFPQRQVEVEKEGREYEGWRREFLSRVRECDGEMETEERLMCSEGERESE